MNSMNSADYTLQVPAHHRLNRLMMAGRLENSNMLPNPAPCLPSLHSFSHFYVVVVVVSRVLCRETKPIGCSHH